MTEHPPKVKECLQDILDFCNSIPPNKNGERQIDATDIFWIIARFDKEVEDYLQHTQTPIPVGNDTVIRLHYRLREAANE